MLYNKLVQVISSRWSEDYDGYEGCVGEETPEIQTIDTLDQFIGTFRAELTSEQAVQKLLDEPMFVHYLEANGWGNLKQAETVAKKATLGSEFFLWDSSQPYGGPRRVNFDKLTAHDAKELAKDSTVILCTITKGSLRKLNKKVHDAYKLALGKAEKRKESRKKAAATRKRNAEAKRIAEAKKVLQDAGEL